MNLPRTFFGTKLLTNRVFVAYFINLVKFP